MIFSGGFGFAGAGKIKPASGETINLVWNGTGTGWSIEGSSTKLYWQDATDTEITSDIPSGDVNDLLALCTLNGEVTLTLKADLTISTLFVFGGNVCTIDLKGNTLTISNTLFLGSSWNNGVDIDSGLIANEEGNGGEGSKLGNLSITGASGSISITNFNTTTWGYSDDNPDVFWNNESRTVNSLLTIGENVTFEVSTWETGSTTTPGTGNAVTTGATIPKITIPENSTTSIEISEITSDVGHESLKDELVKDLIDTGAEVTVPYLWTGNGSDNNWNTAENWTNNIVPSGNVTAYICKITNQPEILESVVFSGGKIEIYDDAKLTIAEGGSLSIDANSITFGTNSSIVVDGTLNSTKGFTVDSKFAGSTGTFSCSDSSNPLIIDTDLELSGNLISSNGTITINSGKNVSCGSINAGTLNNYGTLTLTENSSVGNLSNNGTITIASDKKISVSGSIDTLGNISGIIELIGSTDLGYLDLSKSTDGYDTIIVNKEEGKTVKFGGQTSKIKNVVVESGITIFDTPIEIENFSTSENAGDITFSKNTTIKNACEILTTSLISFGSDENSTTTFGTEENPVNFKHTAGQTNIKGSLTANDIALAETSINGTVTANNITLEATEIKGESELKINEAATSGKITLKGNITSTGSQNLTFNGNVEIPSTSQLEINLNEGILKTKAIKSESSLSIKAKTQTFGGTISVTNDFTSEGETFTFADIENYMRDMEW